MLGMKLLLLSMPIALLWSSISWADSDVSCVKERNQLEWSSGLEGENKKTTHTQTDLCAKQGEWTWTQKYQGELVKRVHGTVKMDSAIKSYAKDETAQDQGFRDIEIKIFALPPKSTDIAYSGYCQFNAKEKSAPCFFVQPDQCKAIRRFEAAHSRETIDLSAKNLSKWVREGKKEKIASSIKKISSDFKNILKDVFREDQNHQKYQAIVNSISSQIPLPRKSKTSLFGSLSEAKSLNQKLNAFVTNDIWDIETYRQWSDLFGKAARACTQIPMSEKKPITRTARPTGNEAR